MYTHCRWHYITSTTTILGASLGPRTPTAAAAFRRTTMFITQPALAGYAAMSDKDELLMGIPILPSFLSGYVPSLSSGAV